MASKRLLNFVIAGLLILYPALVYFGLQNMKPSDVAWLLLAVISVRLILTLKDTKSQGLALSTTGVAAIVLWASALSDSELGLKFYPVAINLTLLCIFALSLIKPPSVIERIARLKEPNLPETGVQYTRKVTGIWCVFFTLNGTAALYSTTLSLEAWTLYNGLISYILMGILLGGEMLYRKIRIQQRHLDNKSCQKP
ncbi:MAG: hypothetical protein K6L73_04100 [Cellvibrionaceae bacterium]